MNKIASRDADIDNEITIAGPYTSIFANDLGVEAADCSVNFTSHSQKNVEKTMLDGAAKSYVDGDLLVVIDLEISAGRNFYKNGILKADEGIRVNASAAAIGEKDFDAWVAGCLIHNVNDLVLVNVVELREAVQVVSSTTREDFSALHPIIQPADLSENAVRLILKACSCQPGGKLDCFGVLRNFVLDGRLKDRMVEGTLQIVDAVAEYQSNFFPGEVDGVRKFYDFISGLRIVLDNYGVRVFVDKVLDHGLKVKSVGVSPSKLCKGAMQDG